MRFETRLKNLEDNILKDGSFVTGMKIMDEIVQAHESDDREAIPDLLLKLHRNWH